MDSYTNEHGQTWRVADEVEDPMLRGGVISSLVLSAMEPTEVFAVVRYGESSLREFRIYNVRRLDHVRSTA